MNASLTWSGAFAEKMIGHTVHVYRLGGVRPEDDPDTEMYLPLPEYGICLVTFKPKEYSHGEGDGKDDAARPELPPTQERKRMKPPLEERLQATYSVQWQGIRLQHQEPIGDGTLLVRELIVEDAYPEYESVFKWIEENATGLMLGVRNIKVTAQTVAEFNRLFKERYRPDPVAMMRREHENHLLKAIHDAGNV